MANLIGKISKRGKRDAERMSTEALQTAIAVTAEALIRYRRIEDTDGFNINTLIMKVYLDEYMSRHEV